MQVVENTPDRLVLRGTPGGRLAMIAAVAIGLVLTAGVAAFTVDSYRKAGGFAWEQPPLLMGLTTGQIIFWTGAVTLAIGRIGFTLDRTSNEGGYEVVSPVVDAGKPCRFKLDDIAHVRIETAEEARPRGPKGREMDATVVRLRVLLTNPRRAITLDETQNGNVERIERLAGVVQGWLAVDAGRETP